jgi:hypothetical protein
MSKLYPSCEDLWLLRLTGFEIDDNAVAWHPDWEIQIDASDLDAIIRELSDPKFWIHVQLKRRWSATPWRTADGVDGWLIRAESREQGFVVSWAPEYYEAMAQAVLLAADGPATV